MASFVIRRVLVACATGCTLIFGTATFRCGELLERQGTRSSGDERDDRLRFGDHVLHTPAARSRLRGPAAPPAWDRRPWRDCGAARIGRVAAFTASSQ